MMLWYLSPPCRASPETVELKGGYTSLGIRVKVLPHIIAFLWLPVESIKILKRVLPQPEEDFKEQMTTFIEKAKLLARSAPRWLWDRLTGAPCCLTHYTLGLVLSWPVACVAPESLLNSQRSLLSMLSQQSHNNLLE